MKKHELKTIIKEQIKSAIKEETEKGDEIVYKLKTKAESGKDHVYDVYITQGKALRNDPYKGLVVSISDTPGAWYIDTLMEDRIRRYSQINIHGRDWVCTNFDDVMDEVEEWLKKNNMNINNSDGITESMKLVDDFFNKLAKELDQKYFPTVKYYRDDANDTKMHYAIELFNNGALTYPKLIDRLSKACKDTKENIHKIASKYVKDFDGYEYKPTNTDLKETIKKYIKSILTEETTKIGDTLMGATQNGTPKKTDYVLVRFENGKNTAIVKDTTDNTLEAYGKSPHFAGYHLIINGADYEFLHSIKK
jgi:hypothetical protein